jgi:hypothetical protein
MATAVRLLVLVAALAHLPPTALGRRTDSFTLTIAAPKDVVKTGTDIRIDITIKNTSDHEIDLERSVRLDLGEWFTDVEVSDEKGNALTETKYYRLLRGKPVPDDERQRDGAYVPRAQQVFGLVRYAVKSGETLPDGLVLNKLVEFRGPGKYTVRVSRRDETSKVRVVSNSIVVTLTE